MKSDSALNLWSGAIKFTVAVVSAGFTIEQHMHFLNWTLKIIFMITITIIITATCYYTIALGQIPRQLRLMWSPWCLSHLSSAGRKAKQLKCHWEVRFPAEISGKAPTAVLLPSCSTVAGGVHREQHCRSA